MQDFCRDVAVTLGQKRYVFNEEIVSRQYELQPEIWQPYGDKGRELALRDSDYHFTYLISALSESDPLIFSNYTLWLRELFEGLRFPPEALTGALECTQEVLSKNLPSEMSTITDQYIGAALNAVKQSSLIETTYISEEIPLYDLARRYLDALLRGDRKLASTLILDAVDRGESIKDIYIYVFQRCQREIGRLWHSNQVGVAQEHYCSAATQLIMSQLYSKIFGTERIGRTLVAACVSGELHEIGIRMVADFFEMDGWDTYYMGANTPTSSIMEAVQRHNADVLAISAGLPLHRTILRELIYNIKNSENCERVKILVGGNAFLSTPDLWQQMGADGFGKDANQAVEVANRLVAEGALN